MARKGENIFRRKDGRWEARYVKGHELSGKIRYGFCYGKTYREAKDKAIRAKTEIRNWQPAQTARDRRLLSFFCDEWLALRRGDVRESTYVKYSAILEKHVKPKLGKYLPDSLDTNIVEDFKWELLDIEDLSAKTVKDIMVVLRAVIIHAVKQSRGMFPMPEFRYPKINRKEMRVLSADEQQRLVSYLLCGFDECRFGVLLALLTGMRLGELCALRWESVSVKEKTIKIYATIQRLKNADEDAGAKTKLWIGNPKSDTSFRIIPMSDSVSSLCKKMTRQNLSAYILTGTVQPMDPRTLQYRLAKYTDACGLEGVHFHTLRHSFATRCVEAGVELKCLSEILGHANTSVTLDRYVHSSLELKRANMNKLPSLNF